MVRIKEGERLARQKVYLYENTNEVFFKIEVIETLSGSMTFKFKAYPVNDNDSTRPEFVCTGQSENEALMGCINRLSEINQPSEVFSVVQGLS